MNNPSYDFDEDRDDVLAHETRYDLQADIEEERQQRRIEMAALDDAVFFGLEPIAKGDRRP